MNILTNALREVCLLLASLFHWRRRNARYIVIIGGPGAGKGTVSSALSPDLGLPHLSMGAVFRREIDAKTELGAKVAERVKAGLLVSDDLTIAALRNELDQPKFYRGAVLDGFPRTLQQARLFERMLRRWGNRVERVILLDVPKADLVERLTHRRTCSNAACGRIYHLVMDPPRQPDRCDLCGSALFQRADDFPEAIDERLRKFREESKPLCDYYEAQSLLTTIRSTNAKTKSEVFAEVLSAVNG